MKRKILVPYISAGLGHFVNAQAVSHYLRLLRPEWEIRLMDVVEEFDDHLLRRAYQELWKTVLVLPPALSSFFFDMELRAPALFSRINRKFLRTSIPKAAEFLAEYRPDAVMSTHWACTHLFVVARGETAVPILNLHGELGGVFALANCGADLYFAYTEGARAGLVSVGVPADRIVRIPFIVHPDMLDDGVPRSAAKRALGIPEDRLTVVFSMGGDGMGPAMKFVDAFVESVPEATLVVLAGRNGELLEEAKRREDGSRVVVYGYLPDISGILSAADLLAGKCGTSFVTLAVKRRIPLIITRIGAPNERDNMRHVVENGFGWLCTRPREFADCLRGIIRDPTGYRQAAERLQAVDGENGAAVIASTIVERLA
jgi:UDP-N-acetylglucosamine:LPS N-acetylglucosamine transferase